MTLQEEEQFLKEQAEMVCNSIAFWEKKIAEFNSGGVTGKDEDDDIYFDGDSIEGERTMADELKYLISHLQFDVREMEKLDKKCKLFIRKRGFDFK